MKEVLFKKVAINFCQQQIYNGFTIEYYMVKKKVLYNFFLRHKPVKILINLDKDSKLRYASILSKEVDCTYSHTVRILKLLQEKGLVEFSKQGRLKTIELTESGREIASHLQKTVNLFDKVEED